MQSDNPLSPEELRAFMRQRQFGACDSEGEIDALHALLSRLIPGPVASTETLRDVQAQTGASLFLKRDDQARACAFIGIFALSAAGARAINGGEFSGVSVRAEWAAPISPSTRLGYVWGFGGADRQASFAILRALRAMRAQLFPNVALYARSASPEGRALMPRFGYRPVSGADDLFFAPAPNIAEQAA